ncbi:MAG TPA: ATP-binding protein [Longimicrobiaceae bacterium]|nr:ATP-binding protein [Longimicrobiaceae bacterium]
MNGEAARHPGLESLREAFFLLDPQWRVTYWNGAAERLFGVGRGDAAGRTVWEAVPGAEEERVRRRLDAAMNGRVPSSYSIALEIAGAWRALAVEAEPAENGGVAVRMRDIADEARASERYLRLLETIRDGFIAVDVGWRIIYVNRVARRLLTMRGAVGTALWDLLPRRPVEIAEVLRATMADRAPRRLAAVRPEGRVFRERYFDLWTDAVPGGGISVLFQDVTEHLERERELARLAAEAEEANRAKGRFFAAVSHELRTPLNAIVGYTHLLSGHAYGPLPPGADRAAERAGVCAEHLSRLVDDVLLLTTAETDRLPVSPREVALAEWLPGALAPLGMQAEAKGLDFAIEVDAATPAVETDPERLRQLLHAVVANAVKFTSRGGIRVAAGPRAAEESGESGVEVAVRDTGPGIPASDKQLIFGPFEQLGDPARHDTMRRGAGLGLTIARQIAHRLRGTLDADPESHDGAVFRLWLPVAFVPPA